VSARNQGDPVSMDPNHSTVLQQPPYFGDNNNTNGGGREDRGRLRDILNPGPGSSTGPGPGPAEGGSRGGMSMPTGAFGAAATSQSQPPTGLHHQSTSRSSSSFSLRSPSQSSEFHHPQHPPPPPALSYPTSNAAGGPRSILNPPFMTSTPGSAGSTSLPPPSLQPPVGLAPSSSSGLHAPDRTSPLHAPAAYYPQDIRDRDRERERQRELERDQHRHKSGTGSFYDPTTDIITTATSNNNSNSTTAKERRISDTAGSWHNSTNTSTNQTVSTPNVSQLPFPIAFPFSHQFQLQTPSFSAT
jgi:DNA helicase INO80